MTLLYFAWVRQKIGIGEETIRLPEGVATVRDLAHVLRARGGAFEDVFSDLQRLRAAVDQAHVGWDAPVSSAREVAFFPPVTGG